MAGFTNRGKKLMYDSYFRAASTPTVFYLVLCTSAVTPTADTNTLSDLTQIASGNGYTTNGQSVSRNSTDFDYLNEDDGNDYAQIQLKDFGWTATGGSLPASGNGARLAVLTDDNATPANRNVIAFWDLSSDRTVSNGQTMTLQNCELRATE
jgi:hypothetical protein